MHTDNQCNKLALNIKSEWVDDPPHKHTNKTIDTNTYAQVYTDYTHKHTKQTDG